LSGSIESSSEAKKNLYKSGCHKVVGIDPGKTNCFSAVTHNTWKQLIHFSGRNINEKERFRTYILFGGQWK